MGNFSNFVIKGFGSEVRDERRIIKGHVTADIVDRQNEYIAIDEVMGSIRNYFDTFPAINDYHSNRIVGKALSYKKSEIDGHPSIYIEAEIFKRPDVSLYDQVWEKLSKGEYGGFSLGGASKNREPIVIDDKLVIALKGLELYEISVCPSPVNQLAIIDHVNEFAKASGLGIKENGGKSRIQCTGVTCSFETTNKASETVKSNDNNLYIDKSETFINNMTDDKSTETTEKVEKSEPKVEKAEPQVQEPDHGSSIDLLTTIVKSHETKFGSIEETLKGISGKLDEVVKKAEDANPVAHGGTQEQIPKVQDAKDVGDPMKEMHKEVS